MPHGDTNGGSSLGQQLEVYFWRSLNRLLPRSPFGDRLYSLLWFRRIHRRWPHRDNRTFHDHLYFTKTTDEIRSPLRAYTSDKELVKLFVRAVAGETFNISTFAVLHSMDEVRAYQFPHRCVIKPTHLSGPVILRQAGEPVSLDEIESWFGQEHYFWTREANYRYLARHVIVEEFVFDAVDVNDYKIFCYRGEPGLIQVDSDRHTGHTRAFFDREWQQQPFAMTYPLTTRAVARPDNLTEMLELARLLSAHFEFVRVDLYSNGLETRVGELTHVHGNIRETFEPRSGEQLATELIFGSHTN